MVKIKVPVRELVCGSDGKGGGEEGMQLGSGRRRSENIQWSFGKLVRTVSPAGFAYPWWVQEQGRT